MMQDQLSSEFTGFFEHAAHGRLAFPRCRACDGFHWYPMPVCPNCQSKEIEWCPVEGTGEIFSYTHVRHAFDKSRRDALPYTVALITFPDAPGVRLISNIVETALDDIAIGRPVAPVFSTDNTGNALVLFRLLN